MKPLVTITLEEYNYLTKELPLDFVASLIRDSIFNESDPNYFRVAFEQYHSHRHMSGMYPDLASSELDKKLETRLTDILSNKKYE